MYQAGLVLEGGGMKGVYTAGVLDFFLDKKITFANCYGVSMGACTLCSYISAQRGRGLSVAVDYLKDPHYCGFYSMATTGDIFNAKMCYDTIPNELNPYDYEAAMKYPGNAYAVMTDVETGAPVYYKMQDMRKDIIAVQASASMPLVSRFVEIDGRKYLDGGNCGLYSDYAFIKGRKPEERRCHDKRGRLSQRAVFHAGHGKGTIS